MVNALVVRKTQVPTSQKTFRAAQYVRMSTDYQRYSIENQAAVIAAYAQLHDLSIIRTYRDEGESGLKLKKALAYLREAYESRVNDEFVFPGRSLAKPISNMTMLKHLKEITADETLTVHGFRTTFRTWAQEETDFEEEIVEHCLHHITGDDAEKAYKRGEALRKRRVVMQAFADFATRPPKNNVTPMKAA